MKTTRIVEYEHGYFECPYCEQTNLDIEFGTTKAICQDIECKKEVKLI